MTFKDIFKNSFLNTISTGDLTTAKLLVTFTVACLFAIYIFVVYRQLTRKTFYSKNFNISLAAIVIIVAAIILTIQSSIVVSLGMVGALSIVRFRTAIKDPMDLVFLFWAISVGIIVGAGLNGIALISSVILTIGIIVLDLTPVAKAPLLLVVHSNDKTQRETIVGKVAEVTKIYNVKSQIISGDSLKMIIEVRTDDGGKLIDSVSSAESVTRCSLVSHDGEVTF